MGYETNNTERQRERRAKIYALKEVPCVDCGGRFPPYVMDFDHREDKKFGISGAMGLSQRTLEEIAKCDVVCANCHRIRTHSKTALEV